ncbi:MAG: hypothetical protein WD989_00450 [Candidatus Paceibacterota bacterium]
MNKYNKYFLRPRSFPATLILTGSIATGMIISVAFVIDGFRNGNMALTIGASVIFVAFFVWLTVVLYYSYWRYGFFWRPDGHPDQGIGMGRNWRRNMKTILVDAIDCFCYKDGTIFREMYELLETYPNKKILLTGANGEQFKEWGLDKMPYEVFTLKHNPEKTDPKYYETMLEHFGLTKYVVVYFEHNPEVVKSAESIGIKSYYYDPEKKDLEALKEFLDKSL